MKGDKLKDPVQWRNWFARIKIYARQKRVWDLVDPHTEEDELEQPIRKPRRPQYPEGGTEIAKREWRDRMDIYKLDLADWEQQNRPRRCQRMDYHQLGPNLPYLYAQLPDSVRTPCIPPYSIW